MPELPLFAKTADDKRLILTEDDWLHIIFRHPEVGKDPNSLIHAVREPDELYKDYRGGNHALQRIDKDHFLVVIYEMSGGEGYIRTAYITNQKRKNRRYRSLRSLKQF